MGSLLQPQTTGVDRREAGPIALKPDEAKNLTNLIGTEDDRELLLAGRTNQIESGDVSVENLLEEELDATQGNGGGRAREFLDILEREKQQTIRGFLAALVVPVQVRGWYAR